MFTKLSHDSPKIRKFVSLAVLFGMTYRSAPQVANLGSHPVQPPFKIPESIIYYFLVASDMRISLNIYVHLNVTKFDRHIFV